MSDEKPYPNNLPPEVTFRQLPAARPYATRPLAYPEMELHRAGGGEDFNLRGLWRIVRKRRWLIVAIAFVVTTLVTIDAFRTKPLYQAAATIEVGRDSATRVGS